MSYVLQQNQLENIFDHHKRRVNQSADETISKAYRGYNWPDMVVPPHLQLDLPFNQIAYEYCDSGKYLYLTKIKNIRAGENYQRVRGRALDQSLLRLIDEIKNYLNMQIDIQDIGLQSFLQGRIDRRLKKVEQDLKKHNFLDGGQREKIISLCKSIMYFEATQITARVQYWISRINDLQKESLISHALPILVEDRLTVKDMGFSEKMTPDFVFTKEQVVGEFKGFKRDQTDKSYRIAVTGYALAYEKTHHTNVDVGCVLFLDIEKTRNTPIYDLDVFVTSDEYRKAFLEKRTTMANIIYKATDPPLATKCPVSCPYLNECKPGSDRIDYTK